MKQKTYKLYPCVVEERNHDIKACESICLLDGTKFKANNLQNIKDLYINGFKHYLYVLDKHLNLLYYPVTLEDSHISTDARVCESKMNDPVVHTINRNPTTSTYAMMHPCLANFTDVFAAGEITTFYDGKLVASVDTLSGHYMTDMKSDWRVTDAEEVLILDAVKTTINSLLNGENPTIVYCPDRIYTIFKKILVRLNFYSGSTEFPTDVMFERCESLEYDKLRDDKAYIHHASLLSDMKIVQVLHYSKITYMGYTSNFELLVSKSASDSNGDSASDSAVSSIAVGVSSKR